MDPNLLPDPARQGFDVRGSKFATVPVPDIPVGRLILLWPLGGRDPVRAKVDDKPDWKRQDGLPVMEWHDGGYTHPNIWYACHAIAALRMCGECDQWGTTDDDYLCEECRQAYVH